MIFQIKENTITAYGTIWDGNGMEFVSIFSQLESKYENIKVKLHTYGGSVFDGNLMFNALCNSKKSVVLEIVGIAASMGAVLLCAGAAGKRSALPHSRVMIHQPSGGAQGVATDMEINLREMLKLKDELYKIISDHSGQSFDRVHKDSERDYWMKADEAKEYGMIDEVLRREIKK